MTARDWLSTGVAGPKVGPHPEQQAANRIKASKGWGRAPPPLRCASPPDAEIGESAEVLTMPTALIAWSFIGIFFFTRFKGASQCSTGPGSAFRRMMSRSLRRFAGKGLIAEAIGVLPVALASFCLMVAAAWASPISVSDQDPISFLGLGPSAMAYPPEPILAKWRSDDLDWIWQGLTAEDLAIVPAELVTDGLRGLEAIEEALEEDAALRELLRSIPLLPNEAARAGDPDDAMGSPRTDPTFNPGQPGRSAAGMAGAPPGDSDVALRVLPDAPDGPTLRQVMRSLVSVRRPLAAGTAGSAAEGVAEALDDMIDASDRSPSIDIKEVLLQSQFLGEMLEKFVKFADTAALDDPNILMSASRFELFVEGDLQGRSLLAGSQYYGPGNFDAGDDPLTVAAREARQQKIDLFLLALILLLRFTTSPLGIVSEVVIVLVLLGWGMLKLATAARR